MLYLCRVTLQQVLSGDEDELLGEKCLSVSVYQSGSFTPPPSCHLTSLTCTPFFSCLCKHHRNMQECTVYQNANTDPFLLLLKITSVIKMYILQCTIKENEAPLVTLEASMSHDI